MFYIYLITNIINNKIYIGQTNNPSLRWSQHKSNAKYNRGNQLITRAIKKYGSGNFVFDVIAMCKDQKDIDPLEEIIIQQYNSRDKKIGYNIDLGGNTSPRSIEVLQKISDGLKRYYQDHDGWLKGKKLSKEWKENISKSSIGKKGTNIGKIFTKEHKEKMSQSHMGKFFSDQHIQNLSESHKGKIAPNRKITYQIAEQIREEYKTKDISQKELGKKYNLSQDSIFNIVNYNTYTKE